MKILVMKYFTGITLFLISLVGNSATFDDKKVKVIHSGDTRGCYFFQLEGVSQAGPEVPGNAWFAFDYERESAQTAFSILLAAKSSGSTVKVNTNGNTMCGYVEVKNISI